MEELRFCECNCGERIRNNRYRFLPGHTKNLANQEPPLCACNCGQKVEFDHWKNRWNKFVNNHYLPTEQAVKNISKAKIKSNEIKRMNRIKELGYPPDCACGCGEKVSMDRDFTKWNDYVVGHSMKNKKLPEERKQKLSEIGKELVGEKNPFYGKTHSKTTKEKLSAVAKKRIGPKANNWKGGLRPIYHLVRGCFKYNEWRISVFTRDGFACQECGNTKARFNAHHIYQFKQILDDYNIKTIEQALACDALWDIDNGITLCKECHKELHKAMNKALRRKRKLLKANK